MPKTKAESSVQSTLFVGSVAKAFAVLEVFREGVGSASLTEVAELTGLGRSAAQRFTHTLTMLGYLVQDDQTRRYQPGLKLLRLGGAYTSSMRLTEVALPHMVTLGEETAQSVHLSQLDGSDIVYLDRLPRNEVRSLGATTGSARPAVATAPGRCLLAHIPATRLDEVIKMGCARFTPRTTIEPSELRVEISRARSQGWAIAVEQIRVGEASAAAPIFGPADRAVAAMSMPVSLDDFGPGEIAERLVPALLGAADAVTIQLGGVKPPLS